MEDDSTSKQKKLFITLEEQLLLDLRKILFEYKLNPQFFFRFMAEKAVLQEEAMLDYLKEAKEEKLEYTRSHLDKLVNVDDIYELIRREQQK
jgi:hypothetical protein